VIFLKNAVLSMQRHQTLDMCNVRSSNQIQSNSSVRHLLGCRQLKQGDVLRARTRVLLRKTAISLFVSAIQHVKIALFYALIN